MYMCTTVLNWKQYNILTVSIVQNSINWIEILEVWNSQDIIEAYINTNH